MSNETGKVAAVTQRDDSYGVKIGKNWFNGFGKCNVEKGQFVSIDYDPVEKNGKTFSNITGISEVAQPGIEKNLINEPPTNQTTEPKEDEEQEKWNKRLCLEIARDVKLSLLACSTNDKEEDVTPKDLADFARELKKEYFD